MSLSFDRVVAHQLFFKKNSNVWTGGFNNFVLLNNSLLITIITHAALKGFYALSRSRCKRGSSNNNFDTKKK